MISVFTVHVAIMLLSPSVEIADGIGLIGGSEKPNGPG
jgi:hypothetical protein